MPKSTEKKRKPGRPKLPKGNAKAAFLRVRLTLDELQAIEATAKASKQTISEWIRSKLTATAEA
jgi:hypothetical protein